MVFVRVVLVIVHHDIEGPMQRVLNSPDAGMMSLDKGDDSDSFRESLKQSNIQPCIFSR